MRPKRERVLTPTYRYSFSVQARIFLNIRCPPNAIGNFS
jgi:hypothetical protein